MDSSLKRCLLFIVLLLILVPCSVSAGYAGHNQKQIYPDSCVPTSFANAVGLPLAMLHDKIDELYRNGQLVNVDGLLAYDAEYYHQGPYTAENVILAMNALGYTVTKVRISPEALINGTIPQWSVFGMWRHSWNYYGYNASTGMITLSNPTYTFPLSDLLVKRVVGGGPYSGQRVYEYSYPDVYVVTRDAR